MELACTLRMVPGAALAGSVAPMGRGTSRLHFPFKHLHHDRTGNHELDKVPEERPLPMHLIERLRLLAR